MTTPSNRYVAHSASGRIRLVVVLIVLAIAAAIAIGGYFLAKGTTPAQTGGGRFGRGGPGGPGAGGGPAMPVDRKSTRLNSSHSSPSRMPSSA